jgi:IclR family transcriptional regulator, KDG regulon repressor
VTNPIHPAQARVNQSVEHAFAALKLFAKADRPLGVVEISRRLALSLGTAHRVLNTLCDSAYVEQVAEGGKYIPGLRLRELLLALYSRFPIRAAAHPFLRAMSETSGLACVLSVPLGNRALRIAGVQDRHVLHRPLQLGLTTALHKTVAAQTILSWMPEDRRAHYLADFVPPGSRDSVAALIEVARRADYLVAESATLTAIAFPVRDANGLGVASIAMEGAPVHFPALSDDQVARWQSIVERLEELCVTDPAVARGPFDHLDPDRIVLDVDEVLDMVGEPRNGHRRL